MPKLSEELATIIGLSKNFANVWALAQPAVSKMVLAEIFTTFAADTEADLVLCALNSLVSTPALWSAAFSHLPVVSVETGLWGLL